MGAIHLKCLERWLEESNRNNCELCGHEFRMERTPRYKVLRSVVVWLCLNQNEHQIYVRNVKADLLRCLIVTPVTIACSYICVVAVDFYAMNNYDNFPPARWTTYSLLSMMALLILSFFVWIYMALQYHQKAWFYWWQKTSSVKIVDLIPGNTTLTRNDKRNVSQVWQWMPRIIEELIRRPVVWWRSFHDSAVTYKCVLCCCPILFSPRSEKICILRRCAIYLMLRTLTASVPIAEMFAANLLRSLPST